MRAEVGGLPRQGPRHLQHLHTPPHPLWVFNPQGVGGGESSGKRKFCYKVATQREPGVWQKIEKKTKKNSKKTEKMKKGRQRTERVIDNFVGEKKSAKNPLSTP